MIRYFLRLAEWLDKRFPPKVTVTEESYNGLQAKEHGHSKSINEIMG